MHEFATGVSLAVTVALAGFTVSLWLTARPLSLRRRVVSLLCPASQVGVVLLAHVAVGAGAIADASALLVAACALACTMLDVAVLRALVEAEGADAARLRAQAAQEQVVAQRAHLQTLVRAQEEASDLRVRTACMFDEVSGALARGEKDRALALLSAGEAAAVAPVRVPCANPVAAALLSAKAARCNELGVAWQCRCELPELIGMPSAELCALLSNLLDNAIEAARACVGGEAFVRSRLRVSHGFLAVSVENPYDPRVATGERAATGDAVPEHGWGTRILESLVRARDGELTVSREDGLWRVEAIVRLD